MEYCRLGSSGLKVSRIGLGAGNIGLRLDEQTSISIVHHALELGINFIDTADWYGKGKSEEFVGKAVKHKRAHVIIATKFGSTMGDDPNERGGSRHYIIKAVEASLRRLGTDYIDLYQMHVVDPSTPIEETLRALDDLVRAGKVRYIGCSNYAAWQLGEALWTSRVVRLEAFVTIQARYNLLDRRIEPELVPLCQKYGVGILPWGPLAGGFLTGKYRRGEPPPASTRLANPPLIYRRILHEANFDVLDRLEAFAAERGHRVGELAIAWLLARPWVNMFLCGPMSMEQFVENMADAQWRLTEEDIALVDEITAIKEDRYEVSDMSFLLK